MGVILSDDRIKGIIEEYRMNGFSEEVLEIAEYDLRLGITKEKQSWYMIKTFDPEKVRGISKAVHAGMPDSILKLLLRLDHYQIDIIVQQYIAGVQEEELSKVIYKKYSAHDMQAVFDEMNKEMAHARQAPEGVVPYVSAGSGAGKAMLMIKPNISNAALGSADEVLKAVVGMGADGLDFHENRTNAGVEGVSEKLEQKEAQDTSWQPEDVVTPEPVRMDNEPVQELREARLSENDVDTSEPVKGDNDSDQELKDVLSGEKDVGAGFVGTDNSLMEEDVSDEKHMDHTNTSSDISNNNGDVSVAGQHDKEAEINRQQDTSEMLLKSMGTMMKELTKSLSEALSPNRQMVEEMTSAIREMKEADQKGRERAEAETEKRLNDTIHDMERRIKDLNKDLESSAGLISSKEKEISELREKVHKMEAEIKNTDAAAENTISSEQDLLARNRAKRMEMYGDKLHANPADNKQEIEEKLKDTGIEDKSNVKVKDKVSEKDLSQQENMNFPKGNGFSDDYTLTMKMPDGSFVPVRVERTEKPENKSKTALVTRLFSNVPWQKSLLNLLIEGKLNKEQLQEIKKARENKFSDAEVRDLIESGLPAEEMAGIIEVVMIDRA